MFFLVKGYFSTENTDLSLVDAIVLNRVREILTPSFDEVQEGEFVQLESFLSVILSDLSKSFPDRVVFHNLVENKSVVLSTVLQCIQLLSLLDSIKVILLKSISQYILC